MQSCYQAKKAEIISILERIAGTKELMIENNETTLRAIKVIANSKTDFSDCLIECSAKSTGCQYSVSFDAAAVKDAGFQAL